MKVILAERNPSLNLNTSMTGSEKYASEGKIAIEDAEKIT
jgi:hypothetical protein